MYCKCIEPDECNSTSHVIARMSKTEWKSGSWFAIHARYLRWQLSYDVWITIEYRLYGSHRCFDHWTLFILLQLIAEKVNRDPNIHRKMLNVFLSYQIDNRIHHLLTNALFMASIKSASLNCIKCLKCLVSVLHTIELSLSERGSRAITPLGRKRCHATKFSSHSSFSSTVAIRPIWL